MGAVNHGPFRLNKNCSKRTCKFKIVQSVENEQWQVNLWLERPKNGTWDEAVMLLYAEMAGAYDETYEYDLNDLFNGFVLRLEP